MHSPTTSHFFPTDNKVIETYRSLSNCPRFFRRSKVRQILPRSASLHRLPTDYGSTRHRKNHVDSSVKVCYKRKKKRKDPTEITWTSSFRVGYYEMCQNSLVSSTQAIYGVLCDAGYFFSLYREKGILNDLLFQYFLRRQTEYYVRAASAIETCEEERRFGAPIEIGNN